MKSKTTTTTNSNGSQTVAPPTWTAPGLNDAAARVTQAMSLIPTSHYNGQQVASYDPSQLAAIQSAWGATAANAGQQAQNLQGMMPTLQGIAQHGGQYSTALPGTGIQIGGMQDATAAIRAAMDPVQKNLMENILPSITNSALAAGAYSGDRAMGVVPGTAIRDANQAMDNTAATIGYQAYNDWQNRSLAAQQAQIQAGQQNYALDTSRGQGDMSAQLQALGLAPEFVNAILHTQASQGDLLNMSAQLGTQQQQLGINDALARDQYASNSPFMGLDTATQLLDALSQNWGTTSSQQHSTQTQVQQQSALQQALGAAMGIGSMAMGMPGGLGGLMGGAAPTIAPVSAGALFAPMSTTVGGVQPLAHI